jgi:hypothetical protein
MMKTHLLIPLLLLSACSGVTNSGFDPKARETGCPLALNIPTLKVDIATQQPPPNKLAYKIDGKLVHDECATPAKVDDKGPQRVVIGRESNVLTSTFPFWDLSNQGLPQKISFEILDRGDCTQEPQVYFSKTDLPLNFENVYPYGETCGASLIDNETYAK